MENDKNLREHVVNLNHVATKVSGIHIKDMRKFGFNDSESLAYNLDKNDFHEYINTWEAYQPRLQDDKYFNVSDDKLLFSLVFGNFITVPKNLAIVTNGELNDVSGENITLTNLYDYFLANNGGVVKYRAGCDGFGINIFIPKDDKLYLNENTVSREELNQLILNAKYCVIQNRMVQGAFENSIFDKTINTIRMISVRRKDKQEHEIIAALQRIGSSQSMPVDNFNQGGLCALIDLETGVIGKLTSANSVDENGNRLFFDRHPDSGVRVEGLTIPNWEKIKSRIVQLTRAVPFFEYIAWDIVVMDDDIALMEINMKSSLNVFQIHGGMRNSFLGEKYREHGWLVDDELFQNR